MEALALFHFMNLRVVRELITCKYILKDCPQLSVKPKLSEEQP